MHLDPLRVELRPAPGEPAVGAWQRTPVSQLTAHLTSVAERPGRTRIIAVDGRSGGGCGSGRTGSGWRNCRSAW